MKRLAFALALTCGFAVLAALAQDAPDAETPDAKEQPKSTIPTVVVGRVAEAPGLDAAHAAWDNAGETKIMTRGGLIGNTAVAFRAVHDGEHVYIRAVWADKTESLNRSWQWTEDGWAKVKGNEDRLSIVFNISTPEFDKEGCDAMCHVDMLYTPGAGQKLDMWHWKAQRGGRFGFSDEQAVISLEDGGNPGGQKGRKSGRINDAGRGGYSDNAADDGKGPAFVWTEDADTKGPFNAETSRATPEDFKPAVGYTVPRERLREAQGSRADVTSSATYADGKWTVVLKRKLNTGHDDDAEFKPGSKTSFAAAVFDNTDANAGNEHSKSAVALMQFEK